jgi:Xaa-Pro aminopeptidase
VEPGIYLPGKGGVRIEDMGVMTENGYENFYQVTKEMIVL